MSMFEWIEIACIWCFQCNDIHHLLYSCQAHQYSAHCESENEDNDGAVINKTNLKYRQFGHHTLRFQPLFQSSYFRSPLTDGSLKSMLTFYFYISTYFIFELKIHLKKELRTLVTAVSVSAHTVPSKIILKEHA